MKIDTKQDDHFFFDSGRQGKFFLALLFVFFVLFGILAQAYKRTIHEELIWLFSAFQRVDRWFFIDILHISGATNWNYIGIIPILILFFTCFILTYKEDIYLYGFKHSFWIVPFIIGSAILWYCYINYWMPRDDATWNPINPFFLYFATWQGWVTILLLFIVNLSGAFAGWQLKELVRIYIKKEDPLIKKAQQERKKIKNIEAKNYKSI